ncbi:3-dehydroquinate synthase [Parapedobacter sp. 10938]|uniref:3-dehydroquinate synthase n=1 Tax=Parapedobacter flavus TaxID=3110225 RepID=UPI002DB56E0D|nr:3-dehydroquinate synthase [Parapedobacter sp. 10938]MEC3880477.1 3-dehydroquinate synthase [Parapedobacter sp. 10938]
MKAIIKQKFSVSYQYDIHFTSGLFAPENRLLSDFFAARLGGTVPKLLVVVDEGVVTHHPALIERIRDYLEPESAVQLVGEILRVPGGEAIKNQQESVDRIIESVNQYGIDRHSYIMAIGGGAVLDAVGYAAAVAHRGVRHLRVPTTVLSQNDSGMGVKNGINYRGKKNFVGTFSPPVAVFNDNLFLLTLSDRAWVSGISEAVKVALIKDAAFFDWIEAHADRLRRRDSEAMDYLIFRCAELHLQHIAGEDPFEFGSSRPLDFGHWSAHKLEQLSHFEVLHGEAVAIGIALDAVYSAITDRLPPHDAQRVLTVLQDLGLPIFHPLLEGEQTTHPLLAGLEEFREHLGGQLTIMLLQAIGKGVEVHALDTAQVLRAAAALQEGVNLVS